MKLLYVFQQQSHDSKLDDVCPKSGPGTRSCAGRRKTSPLRTMDGSGWNTFSSISSVFTTQCAVHNTQCWGQIVGTEQKNDKLLFFAFNAYSASCNVSALELGTLVLFISLHQFDI